MSARDREDFELEDLVARARHGSLTRAEEETLARALAERPELDAAYRVGLELDRETAVQGGDDALIARAADAALARAGELTKRTAAARTAASLAPSAPPASRMRWVAMAAAIALSVIGVSGIATALWTGVMPWPFAKSVEAPKEVERAPEPKKAPRPERRVVAPEAVVLEPAPVIVEEAPATRVRKPSTQEAGALFSDANAARRAGELGRARRLYAALIAEHPSSDEAGLSRVSLGKLLLAAGEAKAAEREFRRYLESGGGQLSEEALVGQAQSLGRLGRADDERGAWERLLQAHPSSVYAVQARQRLEAIERDR
jgi:TolA-binding protein